MKIRDLLKPKGIIAVTTPNIDSLPARILGRRWEEVKRVREHIYFFSDKTFKKLLESTGFKVLKTESAGRYFSVESAIKRLDVYSPVISKISKKIAGVCGIKDMKIYIDPHYKVTLYARKI